VTACCDRKSRTRRCHLKTALAVEAKNLATDARASMRKADQLIASVNGLALQLDEDGSLYYQLGRAYTALGQAEKAAGAMAKYQEILKKAEEQKEEVAREAQIGPPR
jgi:hypothetical protein